MFGNLSDKLQSVFDRLRGRGRLSEQDVNDALREVRLALLEADVSFRVVKEFVAAVREQAVGGQVFESLSGAQTVIRIVHGEMVRLLGATEARILFAPRPPTVIMVCGLQGSGKTTTCGKLANWARRQGRNPMMVACDIHRPAAIRQLQVLGKQLNVPVYSGAEGTPAPQIAADALKESRKTGSDVVILDTAGRLHIDEAMMQEVSEVRKQASPAEVLLVVDAMTGQDAVGMAQKFHEQVELTGFILTKLDGDARGGAALSIRSVTGVPVKFIGDGEKLDALEVFHPDRLASRILGMGDVLSLIEKAQEAVDEKKALELARNLRENRFDLTDYLEQMQNMRKMGPLSQVIGMIPGMSKLKDVEVDEKAFARQEAIVLSMTVAEREDPAIINASRKRRIAAGCGGTVQEVNQFLRQFDAMRQMMKQMMGADGVLRRKKGKFRLPAFR